MKLRTVCPSLQIQSQSENEVTYLKNTFRVALGGVFKLRIVRPSLQMQNQSENGVHSLSLFACSMRRSVETSNCVAQSSNAKIKVKMESALLICFRVCMRRIVETLNCVAQSSNAKSK